MTFSLDLTSRQTSSTFLMRPVSAWMNVKVPSGFLALRSCAIRSPAPCDRPIKYTRGWRVVAANCLKEYSPMPLVPPTKTATSLGGRPSDIRALEDFLWLSNTLLESILNEDRLARADQHGKCVLLSNSPKRYESRMIQCAVQDVDYARFYNALSSLLHPLDPCAETTESCKDRTAKLDLKLSLFVSQSGLAQGMTAVPMVAQPCTL